VKKGQIEHEIVIVCPELRVVPYCEHFTEFVENPVESRSCYA